MTPPSRPPCRIPWQRTPNLRTSSWPATITITASREAVILGNPPPRQCPCKTSRLSNSSTEWTVTIVTDTTKETGTTRPRYHIKESSQRSTFHQKLQQAQSLNFLNRSGWANFHSGTVPGKIGNVSRHRSHSSTTYPNEQRPLQASHSLDMKQSSQPNLTSSRMIGEDHVYAPISVSSVPEESDLAEENRILRNKVQVIIVFRIWSTLWFLFHTMAPFVLRNWNWHVVNTLCFGTQPFYVLLKKKAVRDHKQMYGLISQMVFSSPWKFASLSA